MPRSEQARRPGAMDDPAEGGPLTVRCRHRILSMDISGNAGGCLVGEVEVTEQSRPDSQMWRFS